MRRFRNKLNAKRTNFNGRTYASKLEARVAMFLYKNRDLFPVIEEQVSVPLVVNGYRVCRYVVDFVVTTKGGEKIYIEAKGYWTDAAKIKVRLFVALTQQQVEYRIVNSDNLRVLENNPENIVGGIDSRTQMNYNSLCKGKTVKKLIAKKF